MRLIVAPSIAAAWERAVRHVLVKGVPVTTEDGEETLETDEMIVKVDNPLWNLKSPHARCPCGKNMLDAYADQLIKGTDGVFEYDYHTRLFRQDYADSFVSSYMDEWVQFNQIDKYAIPYLKGNAVSRRAVCVVWSLDDSQKQFWGDAVPCLQWIQFLVRDNKLQMKVLFRSNDVLLAMHANMYALVHLQQYVATALGLPVGSYTHIVTVPHIYYKRDANEVQKWSSTSV